MIYDEDCPCEGFPCLDKSVIEGCDCQDCKDYSSARIKSSLLTDLAITAFVILWLGALFFGCN